MFDLLKIAVVVDSSKNIVFPMIVERLAQYIHIRPFSTMEVAENWILGILD